MPFDSSKASEHLSAAVRAATEAPETGWPAGCPARELTRSPAAAAVGRLAARDGLRLFHTEWRHPLPLPEDWVPAHDPALADPPSWGGGVLPERKYQAFRHDQALGGFHPGMRAKWATHELCHGLVGFAWRPGASPLFLATAGRLSELLPVVLWYFFDEAHLRRCPRHAHGGALYRSHCPACEAAAEAALDDVFAESAVEEGRLFLERELEAITRTIQRCEPVPHVHGSLDLCSDGIAYAAAHGPRLRSEAFERFIDGFAVEGGGWVTSLDALRERVLSVCDAIVLGEELPPLAPSRAHGEARWVLQDLGWRLLSLWHETEGEAADALLSAVDTLSAACTATVEAEADARALAVEALRSARATYEALHDEVVVPDPDVVWSLGHDLLGTHPGRSHALVRDGVVDALPLTSHLLGARLDDAVGAFLAQDRPVRVPLGRRVATWIAGTHPAELAALARYEAALTHLPPADPLVTGLGAGDATDAVRLADGVAILREELDVVELARSVDFGDVVYDEDGVHDVDGQPIAERSSALVLVRSVTGEPVLLDVEPDVGDALLSLWQGGELSVPEAVRVALMEHGILRPLHWAL